MLKQYCKITVIEKHSRESSKPPLVHSVNKKKVYIELPFKGDIASSQTRSRLTAALNRTFYAAQLVVIERTRRIPLSSIKVQQPIDATSHCIYQFSCNCGESYIGRTDRLLETRIKEHLPKWVMSELNRPSPSALKLPTSSIGKHVLIDAHQVNTLSTFKVILRHTNPNFLRFAEAVAIRILKPSLCVHKQFVVNLRLPWT